MDSIIKKRGQHEPAGLVFIPALCLLLVFGFFFLPILADITGIRETTYFEKNFLVRDMATDANSLYAGSGNTIINYNKDTMQFSYEFNKDNVAVFDETAKIEDILQYKKTEYPIISNNLLNFNPITLNAEFYGEEKSKDNLEEKVKPIFAKINDDIIINKEINRNINEIKCINTGPIESFQNKIVLIDAGHGSDDNGITTNNIKEKGITASIGFFIYQNLENNKLFTRKLEDIQIRKEEYKNKEKIVKEVEKNNINVIISIHSGNYADNSNNIKAYYSIESNEHVQSQIRKIACTILNELINQQSLEITGISIIPIYPEDYEGGEMLVKDKIAVLFEIGNLNNQGSVDTLTNTLNIQIISNSIIKGLKK